MDRLGFFKHGLSSVMEAAQAVVGLKKAAETFTEVIDDALRDVSPGLGLYLPSIDATMYDSPSGTLYEVGQMGYTKVEAGCYYEGTAYGVKAEELRTMALSSGLKIMGLHLNKFYEKGGDAKKKADAEKGTDAEIEASAEKGADAEIEADAENGTDARNEAGNATECAEHAFSLSDECRAWWGRALDSAKTMGCKFVTMSQFPEEISEQTIEEYAGYFNFVGMMAQERGLRFSFHPSKAELQRHDGRSTFEELAERCDTDKVWFELDTFEAHGAGVDMCHTIKQHAERIIALHLHDYDIVGESGEIDFNKILHQAEQSKIEEVFIEVRSFPLPPQNCAERSLRNVEMLDSVKI